MTLTPMREEARDDAARPDAGIGLSRRRVLQGMAWATPAVVIASATPASAASQDLEPGAIGFAGMQVSRTASSTARALEVEFSVAHLVPDGADVTDVVARVIFSAGMVAASLLSYSGAGWTQVGTGTLGDSSRYFDFSYAATLVAGGLTSLLRVVPSVPGTGFFNGTVGVHISGTTAMSGLPLSLEQDASVGLNGAMLRIDHVDVNPQNYGSVPARVNINPQPIRFNGNWSPASPPASSLVLVATVSDTLVDLGSDPTTAVNITSGGGTWSVQSAVKQGNSWVMTFAANPSVQVNSSQTTAPALNFDAPTPSSATPANWHGTVAISGSAMSDGARVMLDVNASGIVTF